MELPNVGKNCDFEMCQQLDFLPYKCDFCCKTFCQLHYLTDKHNCPSKEENINEKEIQQQIKYSCSFLNCGRQEFTSVECSHCLKNFCIKHRHQMKKNKYCLMKCLKPKVDHKCSEYTVPTNPLSEAAAKIHELTKHISVTPKKISVKNEKLAAKVQLMKLKGKASGNKNLTVEERIFFSIRLPRSVSSKENSPIPIFVSVYWTVGKAVDVIAEIAKVPNRNNESTAPRLFLFRASDGKVLKPFDITVKSLVDQEEIFNGQTLILEYTEKILIIFSYKDMIN